MTEPSTAQVEQEVVNQKPAGERPSRPPMIPCEVNILFTDKINETLVTVDQPQMLPSGLLQCHCGNEIVLFNPQSFKRVKIKIIEEEEKRIIS